MYSKKRNLSRRNFIKTAGAASLGSAMVPFDALARVTVGSSLTASVQPTVPTRPFGKTGVKVSILSLGGVLGPSDQIVFRQAFKMGVKYWDTADSYGRGKNEKAIGKYFGKFPQDRGKVFLVTKSATSNPKTLTEKLNRSLQRMKTSYVDLYFIHYVKDVEDELTADVKAWAEKSKAEGKIRLFGFSTHKNMENCMLAAAKLGWIDGIMMSYNHRLMVNDQMKRAVDACVKAGIGLTAMKTQAAFSANFYAAIGSKSDQALKLTERFMQKGYTLEQAKLKAVWENPNIASICSAMSSMTILQANIDAAVNRKKLSSKDILLLDRYTSLTSAGYCAGCAHICESTINHKVPISNIMRYAMYHNSYKYSDEGRTRFNALPDHIKSKLLKVNYSSAEKHCPQKIEIGKVIKEMGNDLSCVS
ncbi:aldo/keto reductase [Thermodesulfobacteriota bacterium]